MDDSNCFIPTKLFSNQMVEQVVNQVYDIFGGCNHG